MKQMIRTWILLATLIVTLMVPAAVITTSLSMSHNLEGKIKPLELPMGKPSTLPAAAVKVKVAIVFPEDGTTLDKGTHTVLVSANSKSGIAKVEIEIDGPETVSSTEMTLDVDETYYTYVWVVSTDGTYVLTATATDNNSKTATDKTTVSIGEPQPDKWAVVIGIADYKGLGSDLWHPDEDALDMVTVLEENGYTSDHIKLLLNRKATARAIESAINWLATNEKAGDEVVFFYSGHGSNISDAEGWDADIENDGVDEMIVSYDFYGLTDGWLKQKFATIESTKFALMFGSCFSGGMFDDNDDLQGTGRVIASACAANQLGWDYLELGNTLWGYYFIDQGLLNDIANSVESAQTYAMTEVPKIQPDSQPQIYDNYPGDFTL